MPTPTEARILQERRAVKSGAILVPILEKLLEREVIPEDEEDFRFIEMLTRARAIPRSGGVFSPSMLGSCIRKSYFAKRGEKKIMAHNPQTNGYFLKGNFTHFQWQFAMWKAHRKGLLELVAVPIGEEVDKIYQLAWNKRITKEDAKAWMDSLNFYGNATRPAVEVRVIEGDFGGTIDVIAKIEQDHIIDFKGINLVDYQRAVKKGAPQEYRKQIVGYGKIAAEVLSLDLGDCLLVYECKAGPVSGSGSPIALHETRVPIAEFDHEVERRLKALRFHDHRNQLPEAECVSTRHMQFAECPFNRHCLEEVRAVQRERERRAREHTRDWKPSRPKR